MRSTHLKRVTASPAVAGLSAICRRRRRPPRSDDAGVCCLCLAHYRLECLIDHARLAAVPRWLLHRPQPRLAGWPAEVRRTLARTLVARLLWNGRSTACGGPFRAAASATLADTLDECSITLTV
jgi:hypothetical protein